eukprot:1800832-Amphidinium_carterae.1
MTQTTTRAGQEANVRKRKQAFERVCFVEIGLDASAARTLKDNTCQLLGRSRGCQKTNGDAWAIQLRKDVASFVAHGILESIIECGLRLNG